MTTLLECAHLGKRYGRTWALRDCNLRLSSGNIIGLIGPNGAGKTTLLQLAMGLLTPDTGTIKVLGYEPHSQSADILHKVGFVAQDHPLLKTFTVKEMMEFGRKMNHRWDQNFAIKRLEQLGITQHHLIDKLSGGQQAQVALIVALAKRPQLLILDEPVASLDPLARREFQKLLMEAAAEHNLAVILSSHIVTDLERLCDFIVILSTTQVQLASDIEQLLQSHKLLIGPQELAESITSTHTILQANHDERQSKFIVQDYKSSPGAAWKVQDLSLEDITLAYLEQAPTKTLINEGQ